MTSPRVMRQMPRLIQQASLQMDRMFPYTMVEVGKGDFWLSGIDAYEKLAPKSGTMTEEEATSWANALHKSSDQGVFLAPAITALILQEDPRSILRARVCLMIHEATQITASRLPLQPGSSPPGLIARGDPPPLLESVHAPLHQVAPAVGLAVALWWPTPTALALVVRFGDSVRDAPAPKQPTAGREAVAPVGDEAFGPLAWTAFTCAWHLGGVEHLLKLRAFVALTRRYHDRERTTSPVAGEVQLRAQPATASP